MSSCLIRAAFSEDTVRVYQAFREEVAIPALEAGTFVAPFSMSRMTWIKPSFNWMMYRSGYGTKSGQEFVLGIDITRSGFEWALDHAVLSNFNGTLHSSYEAWRKTLDDASVRVQWDPERDWRLNALENVRAIQIGLSGEAVERYVTEWIKRIEDVTPIARGIAKFQGQYAVPENLPHKLELEYPLSTALRMRLSKTVLPAESARTTT
jgi:hypothetical protein